MKDNNQREKTKHEEEEKKGKRKTRKENVAGMQDTESGRAIEAILVL
jgi:hypothetical protein